MTKEQLGTMILDSERQLYSTAKTILYNDQDCADAIQETVVKAFSKINTLKNDKYAKTWLIRILINECYILLRKSSKLVPLEEMGEVTEIRADKKNDYSDLYRAINSLKEDLRLPVILYYIEDFKIKEIAQILEITEGAVQKRLARARGKLRCDLQKSEVLID
ncbi:MAG: sigma-70 family RNA polymerase sigma factor [Lachnospiraceae bacterium]|nr:sigma-70 family RNA polymerase sigma factor [Lachnospiraceae bacterium]MDD3617240.1 sigma-70 family RNA polymerase sigma factor [Lachnospiraceae bacterium]